MIRARRMHLSHSTSEPLRRLAHFKKPKSRSGGQSSRRPASGRSEPRLQHIGVRIPSPGHIGYEPRWDFHSKRMIVRFTMMFESHPKDGRRIEFFRGAGLSGPDSLLAGKLTGNFAHLAPFRQMRLSTGGQDQWFASKFPTMVSREFCRASREFSGRCKDSIGPSRRQSYRREKALAIALFRREACEGDPNGRIRGVYKSDL